MSIASVGIRGLRNLLVRWFRRWVDPGGLRYRLSGGRTVFKAQRVLIESRQQDLVAPVHHFDALSAVNAGGREQGDTAVVVVMVVPVEKTATEGSGVLQ